VFFTSFDRENRHATFPSQDPTKPPFYRYRQYFQVLTREHLSVSIRRLVLTFFALGALYAPAAAMAQDNPIVQVYGGKGPTVENQITPPGQVEAEVVSSPKKSTPNSTSTPSPTEAAPTAASQPQAAKGSLPFTGLDARLLALAGLALAGIGFATRRLAQRID
jgi:hypothetical protein